MKKKHYVVLLSAMILLILAITSFIYYSINTALASVDQNAGIIVPDKEPVYHFAMVCENVDDPFWLSIKKGVEKASKEFNVAVEFNGPGISNMDEQWKYLDMAIASRVDGIVTYVWDEDQAGELINKGVKKNIPVVTIGRDAKASMRTAFVGMNAYSSGVQLGRMALAATGDEGDVAVLIGKNQVGGTMLQNLMISGIKDAFKIHDRIDFSIIEYDDLNFLGIEDTIKDLLTSRPELDTIVCTTASDTIAVAQRLIDLNKVGYNIIGYGDSPELLGYIDSEVVFGTVTANHEQMGYDAIRALMDIKEKGRTSAYFTVETRLITKANVDEYLKPGED